MITCEDLVDLVAQGEDRIQGRPDVAAHLAGCARCQREIPSLVQASRIIREMPPGALSAHPSSEDIVAMALADGTGTHAVHPQVVAHVSACPACAAEVEEVRRAERNRQLGGLQPTAPPARTWPGASATRLAWAASLGFLVLLYPALRGLREVPRLQARAGDLAARTRQLEAENRRLSGSLAEASAQHPATWSGPVGLATLSSPRRGPAPKQTIHVDPAQPYVLVCVRPILAEPAADSDVYQFAILSGDGRDAWTHELTAGEIRRRVSSSGTLIFPIPSPLLPPGEHELRVLPKRRAGEPVLQIPFEVVPGG